MISESILTNQSNYSMKKILSSILFLTAVFAFSQNPIWQKETVVSTNVKESRQHLPVKEVYSLNLNNLQSTLESFQQVHEELEELSSNKLKSPDYNIWAFLYVLYFVVV